MPRAADTPWAAGFDINGPARVRQPPTTYKETPMPGAAECRRASLTVVRNARSTAEAKELLQMLGLMPADET